MVTQKWVTFLLSNPIPKPITNNGKKDVFEVVPNIEVLNHLGVGFCQELWSGHIYLLISSHKLLHCYMAISTNPSALNNI
jgi:hypothetical protein